MFFLSSSSSARASIYGISFVATFRPAYWDSSAQQEVGHQRIVDHTFPVSYLFFNFRRVPFCSRDFFFTMFARQDKFGVHVGTLRLELARGLVLFISALIVISECWYPLRRVSPVTRASFLLAWFFSWFVAVCVRYTAAQPEIPALCCVMFILIYRSSRKI